MITQDAGLSYDIASLPPGIYYFRVYAVTSAGLSPASTEFSVTIPTGTSAAGPVTGLRGSLKENSATLLWEPPAFGTSPSLYYVEFGTAPGKNDIAVVYAVNPVHTRSLPSGTTWMRVRAVTGGLLGSYSNDVALTVGGNCTGNRATPVMLPVTTGGGAAVFSWLPGDVSATDYTVTIAGAGSATVAAGQGSSVVWRGAAGTYSATVAATGFCGTSSASNTVSFTIQ